MRRALFVNILILMAHSSADARTDVNKSLETLKTNMENSQANLDQYDKNKQISSRNVEETKKALAELKKLEKTLLDNTNNIDKNKAQLDKMKIQIQGYKKNEVTELEKEKIQIADVQKLLEKLQANAKQRETNVAAYDLKIEEIEKEKKGWDQQNAALAELKQEIQVRTAEANKENEKWKAKEKTYAAESQKWGQQASASKANYLKFKHLSEK